MPWVRFEDKYPINRKVGPLSDAAFRLDVEAICWSSRETTDGVIRAHELTLVRARATKRHAAELVTRGRWHPAGHQCNSNDCPPSGPDGWVIHDYWQYQPTKAQVEKDRIAKAERQRRWIDARKGKGGKKDASQPPSTDTSQDGTTDTSQPPSVDGVKDAVRDATPAPAPPRPEGKRGGDLPEATAARRQAADAAGGGRAPNPPGTRPPSIAAPGSGLPDPDRRAELAAAVRAAAGGDRRPPAEHRRPTTPPAKRPGRSVAELVATVDPPAPPARSIAGLGFCVDCHAQGQTTIATDPEKGSHCAAHQPPEPQ